MNKVSKKEIEQYNGQESCQCRQYIPISITTIYFTSVFPCLLGLGEFSLANALLHVMIPCEMCYLEILHHFISCLSWPPCARVVFICVCVCTCMLICVYMCMYFVFTPVWRPCEVHGRNPLFCMTNLELFKIENKFVSFFF